MQTLEQTRFGSVPHGGELINRFVPDAEKASLAEKAGSLPAIELSPRQLSDVEMIAIGGYSPLTGFMTQEDYESVVRSMRLANGLPWTIPIALAIPEDLVDQVRGASRIALSFQSEPLAVLEVQDVFT